MPGLRILVLGGSGFIGRHAAAALRARGHAVLIGTRRPQRALRKLPPALRASLHDVELRETHLESLTTRYVWQPLLRDVDVVVNAVGILRERGSATYDRVHHMAPAALALACERLGLRLLHVSALGLRSESRSRFLRSILAGERAIAATAADYSLVRASLLDGEGGYGAAWLRRVACWPIHAVPSDARGRSAALDVRDLGDALAALSEIPGTSAPRVVELGGSAPRTMAEYLAALRATQDERGAPRPALRLPVPALLARLGSHLCDLLHFSPFSYGHLELMQRDNLPRENLLQALIGRAPAPVGGRARAQVGRDLRAPRPAYAFAATPAGHETPVPPSPQ